MATITQSLALFVHNTRDDDKEWQHTV